MRKEFLAVLALSVCLLWSGTVFGDSKAAPTILDANDDEPDAPHSFHFDAHSGVITGYDMAGGPDVVIPSTIEGQPVLGIADWAFQDLPISSVHIPDTVVEIGAGAFFSTLLTHVTVPDSVETIGRSAFFENQLKSVALGQGVREIGDSAFRGNAIASLSLPITLREVSERAFSINALTEVNLDFGVKTIDYQAFCCNDLRRITIGADVDMHPEAWDGEKQFAEFYMANESRAGIYEYVEGEWQYSVIVEEETKERLLTAYIEPHSEPQIIMTEDNVGLIVGADFVTEALPLSIERYSERAHALRSTDVFVPLSMYSFQFDGLSEWDDPLLLQIPVPQGYSLDDGLIVGWWNAEAGAWREVPYYANLEENLIFVVTDHFSSIGISQDQSGTYVVSRNFQVYFDPDAADISPGADDEEPVSIRDFAIFVSQLLESYVDAFAMSNIGLLDRYQVTGVLRNFLTGSVPQRQRFSVDLCPDAVNPVFNVVTTRITIPLTGHADLLELRPTLGHELFHLYQYLYDYPMWKSIAQKELRVIEEITAEYAGHRLYRRPDGSFLDFDLTDTEYGLHSQANLFRYTDRHQHQYAMARFLDFMIRANENADRGAVFRQIWNEVVASTGSIIDYVVEDFLEARQDRFFSAVLEGTPYLHVGEAVMDFAGESLMDSRYVHEQDFSAPDAVDYIYLDYSNPEGILYTGPITVHDDHALALGLVAGARYLPAEYHGQMLPIYVEFEPLVEKHGPLLLVDSYQVPLNRTAAFIEDREEGFPVLYQFRPYRTTSTAIGAVLPASEPTQRDPWLTNLQAGIKLVAYGERRGVKGNLTIRDARIRLDVEPAEVTAEFDTEGRRQLSFRFDVTNIPENLDYFYLHWDFGDNHGQGHKLVLINGTSEISHRVDHTYMQPEGSTSAHYTVHARIVDPVFDTEGPRIARSADGVLLEATADVYLDEAEVPFLVRIGGPSLVRYDLPATTDSLTHSFSASVNVPGVYRYVWTFGDGAGVVDEASQSSGDYVYRDLVSGQRFHPQVKVYDLETDELLATAAIVIEVRLIEEREGSFVYSAIDDGTALRITGFTGSGGSITIPAEDQWRRGHLPVTELRHFHPGFEDPMAEAGRDGSPRGLFQDIESITMPEGITVIGVEALADNRLSSVTIPDSVRYIATGAFSNNRLQEVVIPPGVRQLGTGAFSRNQLTTVSIPAGISAIPASSFADNRLESVELHDGVSFIGIGAFANNQLTSIELPSALTHIEASAFSNNELTEVSFPETVATIGQGAFSYNRLTEVSWPIGVPIISARAFENNQLTDVVIPPSVAEIGDGAFASNAIRRVIIPGTVSKIGSGVFAENPLTGLLLEYGIEYIGQGAFRECELRTVTIPGSVKDIGQQAFARTGLEELVLEPGIVSIGRHAFAWNNLREVTIPSSVESIDFTAFHSNNRDFVVCGVPGSEAEAYAERTNSIFVAVEEETAVH